MHPEFQNKNSWSNLFIRRTILKFYTLLYFLNIFGIKGSTANNWINIITIKTSAQFLSCWSKILKYDIEQTEKAKRHTNDTKNSIDITEREENM